MTRQLVIAIVGPTGSGKTTFATEMAERLGGEVIGLDSTTIYRGFNIGTAKPTPQELARVPHHLVDVLDPCDNFSAFQFVEQASQAIQSVHAKGKIPFLVGGTYFYLRALQNGMYPQGLLSAEMLDSIEKEFIEDDQIRTDKMHAELAAKDPKAAAAIHPNDKYRLLRALTFLRTTSHKPSELEPIQPEYAKNWMWMKYALTTSRHHLTQSIMSRTEKMLQAGLVEETRNLLEKWPGARALQSIGYAECVRHLQRELTEKQLRNEIIEKTRQLAKRQTTWIRSDPEVRFIDLRDRERVETEIKNLLEVLR